MSPLSSSSSSISGNEIAVCCISQETGARVDVFPICCPQSTDRVVRVCGMPVNIAQCIFGLYPLIKQVCTLCIVVPAAAATVVVVVHCVPKKTSPTFLAVT